MFCSKCGNELPDGAKFCDKCGANVDGNDYVANQYDVSNEQQILEDAFIELGEQPIKKESIFLKNKKRILAIILILLFLILCAIFKYKMLLPSFVIVILGAVIMINRKILRKRSKKNTKEVTQYTLKDSEISKFAEYFVNSDEKYVSSLGNGYIMNYLANGSLSKGFAVISDKRVYFRGSCLSGQGKSLHKTDEERTVDIKDVTGSGFIYQRYIGILIGLFVALLALIGGICGSAAGAWVSWERTLYEQQKEDEAAEIVSSIEQCDKRLGEIEKEVVENQEKMQALQDELAELEALQTQSLMDDISLDDFLYDTEINAAYEDYLYQLTCLFESSNTYDLLNSLKRGAEIAQRNLSPGDADYKAVMSRTDRIINEVQDGKNPDINGNNLIYYYEMQGCLYITPESYCQMICGYSSETLKEAYWAYDYTQQYYESYDWIIYKGWLENNDLGLEVSDYSFELEAELGESFLQAYRNFMNVIAPDYLNQDEPALEEIVLGYLDAHPDASFSNAVNLSGISTEYDDDVQEVKTEIADIELENQELADEADSITALAGDSVRYESDYEWQKQKTFGYFMLTTLATASAGLLMTFLISCFLVFLDYLKKRKTMFQIQYAGGSIAFDVSYYAKAEIEDFQKQLRRAKDLNSHIKNTNVSDIAAQKQTVSDTKEASPSDELRKYADLLKEGLITQDEYDAMKKKVLGL